VRNTLHPAAFREAGYEEVKPAAAMALQIGPQALARFATMSALRLRGPNIWPVILEQGWATETEMESLFRSLEAWASSSDALRGELVMSTVARRPSVG
jgi:hypothetical protein